jgi:hypothetical protein
VDWFLDGYGWDGAYHHPPMDLISLYVDQTPRAARSHEKQVLQEQPRSPE